MRGLCSAVGVVGCLALVGCGGSDPFNKQAVSGTVKLKGQPVKSGMIYFEPADTKTQVATNCAIVDGAFQLTQAQGLSVGKYSWKLNVPDREIKHDPTQGEYTGPQPKNVVPAKDNGGSFDVKAGQENKLEINIP